MKLFFSFLFTASDVFVDASFGGTWGYLEYFVPFLESLLTLEKAVLNKMADFYRSYFTESKFEMTTGLMDPGTRPKRRLLRDIIFVKRYKPIMVSRLKFSAMVRDSS